MTYTMGDKQNEKAGLPRLGKKLLAAGFWLLLWQLAAMGLGQELLLASPVSVLRCLFELLPTGDFWRAVLFSFSRITLGFLLACLAGTLLAALAARVMAGEPLAAMGLPDEEREPGYFAVKESVMPWSRFPGSPVTLGPEMRSTGEVMGVAPTFPEAYAKTREAIDYRPVSYTHLTLPTT